MTQVYGGFVFECGTVVFSKKEKCPLHGEECNLEGYRNFTTYTLENGKIFKSDGNERTPI